MRAVLIHAAKDLRVEERAPEAVGPGEVEVAVEAGGICGSDLHHYQHGGFGTVRLKEPMILGHEVAGRIRDAGADYLLAVKGNQPSLRGELEAAFRGAPRRDARARR